MTAPAEASAQTVINDDEGHQHDGAPESRTPDEIIESFVSELRNGKNWFYALLNAVAQWNAPYERVDDRDYTYVIAGEAFDWLQLAERLIQAGEMRIPEGEATRLLFEGRAPVHINADDFRRAIGHGKHAAHLNFLYGIVVEEALQQANIEEVAKAQQNLAARETLIEDEAMNRLYGASTAELRTEFRRAAGKKSKAPARTSLNQQKAFTYWLFKRRVSKSDPARLASDTRKGILVLERIKPALWQWSQGENS